MMLTSFNHELRTPTNIISNGAEVVKKHVSKQGLKTVEIIICSTHFLISLVNDVMDYSALQSGELKLHYEVVDVR
jgi:signal transduction histidine kinase